MTTIAERYRYWRQRGLTATRAIGYARYAARMAALSIDWTFDNHSHVGASFVCGTLTHDGVTFKVYVGDDDPTDWGDIEPTDDEREAAQSYWIGVTLDADDTLGDSIGGVDVIDLPGYLQRDWEDAARYALLEYLLPYVEHEASERAHWAARDTITV